MREESNQRLDEKIYIYLKGPKSKHLWAKPRTPEGGRKPKHLNGPNPKQKKSPKSNGPCPAKKTTKPNLNQLQRKVYPVVLLYEINELNSS